MRVGGALVGAAFMVACGSTGKVQECPATPPPTSLHVGPTSTAMHVSWQWNPGERPVGCAIDDAPTFTVERLDSAGVVTVTTTSKESAEDASVDLSGWRTCQSPPGEAYAAGGTWSYRVTAVTPAGASDPVSATFGFGCGGAP